MSIIVPRSSRTAPVDGLVPPEATGRSRDAWRLLSWIGAVFAVLGLVDIALGWYPAAFGNSEWEFGTISGTLNALTIPVMGLYLLAASAIARGDLRSGRILGAVMAIMALGLLMGGFLYITVAPIALKAVAGNDLVHMGMKKAIVKAMLLGVGYTWLLVLGALRAWRVRVA